MDNDSNVGKETVASSRIEIEDEAGADHVRSTPLSDSTSADLEAGNGDGEQDRCDLPPVQQAKSLQDVFSVFTVPQKRAIVLTASLISFLSPMSGSIYYPATTTIANDLGVSSTDINLTVTTYLIIQGLAPMLVAGFSDSAGRRPAYAVCFIIYMIACLALALQNSYIALLLLRMLQSGGSSGTIALAQAVVGDTITSAERGSYIAFASVSSILGPTISPIIGGLLSQYLGWHSVFWFCLTFAGVLVVPLAIFMPETCRNVVGDASIPPPRLNMNVTDRIRFANRDKAGIVPDPVKMAALRKNRKISFPNPLSTLVIFTDLQSSLILVAAGLALALFYAISTGASLAFKTLYGFDDVDVSLMFIPLGVGGTISVFTTGNMVDWNYRRHAKLLGFPVDKLRQRDLIDFPIERARLEIALPLFWLGGAGVIGYGWIMDHKVSLAGPIILLFIVGYGLTAAFQVLNVLMVDIYPGRAATATAANNIVRCELGAAASAAVVPMSNAMGNGWAYTTLGLIFAAFSPALLVSMKYGMSWRQAKRAKQESKKAIFEMSVANLDDSMQASQAKELSKSADSIARLNEIVPNKTAVDETYDGKGQ